MARKARRPAFALRIEELEARALLSVSVGTPDPAATLLVRFEPGASASVVRAAFESVGAHPVESFPDGPTLAALDPGRDPAAAAARLRSNLAVLYAEPDETFHSSDAVIPNDP